MADIRIERDVDAPAEDVWAVLTDVDGFPEVLSAVDSVERLDDGPFQVGTRWRETRTVFGRQATEELEVTSLEPGRSYTVEADSGGTRYRSTLSVEPLDAGGCRLTMTFGAEPGGLLSRVFTTTIGRLFEGATRKQLEQDLDDIAAAATAVG